MNKTFILVIILIIIEFIGYQCHPTDLNPSSMAKQFEDACRRKFISSCNQLKHESCLKVDNINECLGDIKIGQEIVLCQKGNDLKLAFDNCQSEHLADPITIVPKDLIKSFYKEILKNFIKRRR